MASEVVNRFVDLFGQTFSISRNAEYVTHVRKAFEKKRYQRLVGLWREAYRMAMDRINGPTVEAAATTAMDTTETTAPRKRRRVASALDLPTAWNDFLTTVGDFDLRHVQKGGKSKFVFSFVEGPLAKAIRNGDWVLLDEVNLASAETLESLSTLLQTPDSSLILAEQGDLEPIPRHPEFRLFACMNPATDVGKRDLPAGLRAKFSEIWVPSPDEDRDALVKIIEGYIGGCTVHDRPAIHHVADLYTSIKALATGAQLADGSNQPPHFSIRTLARALTFTSEFTPVFGLRRSLYEGFVMAFTMLLDPKSSVLVKALLDVHIVAPAKNRGSLFSQIPTKPASIESIRFGPYWLETGPEALEEPADYILTPSVQLKVLDLARAVLTRKVPVLIQGPTSSGKTSVVEYLARRTGHRFVRINNHEHTDIQEYIGTYVSDPDSGKLVFQEGVLVRALRRGDWIVLDELNLAPTDVLEALNRLLDDNRELVIPETGEVVRPHPHFMLFATQNPPGLYGGRKVLSRAFRNRFLEMHFGDVPKEELEEILCRRCQIAPSYAKKTVAVFLELQRRRQAGRVFEAKNAFATLRDLFRWGGRGSVGYQQLAEDGYMLLAERARKADDKAVVKAVIEEEMKVVIDDSTLYDFSRLTAAGLIEPPTTTELVWTNAMRRLYYLIAAGLHRNEPILLVGETGSGKTSVCQSLALALGLQLHVVGCHQNTETADLLGGQRPLRNRAALQSTLRTEALTHLAPDATSPSDDFDDVMVLIEALEKATEDGSQAALRDLAQRMRRTTALFEWHDGPLVQAMHAGDLILLDEISLADDSVLERLNSVLEPSRTLVLAEKGGRDLDDIRVVAHPTFQILATMNPGGDFGKKELSPALRNRFTEIWVPLVDDPVDLLQIIGSRWQHLSLESFGPKILDFGKWFGEEVGVVGGLGIGLRDILAWVDFLNASVLRTS
jgi:midasin